MFLIVILQEFIIHTPSEDAQKMYIGNALKGNYAAVFAQLIINGESQGKTDAMTDHTQLHYHHKPVHTMSGTFICLFLHIHPH